MHPAGGCDTTSISCGHSLHRKCAGVHTYRRPAPNLWAGTFADFRRVEPLNFPRASLSVELICVEGRYFYL